MEEPLFVAPRWIRGQSYFYQRLKQEEKVCFVREDNEELGPVDYDIVKWYGENKTSNNEKSGS